MNRVCPHDRRNGAEFILNVCRLLSLLRTLSDTATKNRQASLKRFMEYMPSSPLICRGIRSRLPLSESLAFIGFDCKSLGTAPQEPETGQNRTQSPVGRSNGHFRGRFIQQASSACPLLPCPFLLKQSYFFPILVLFCTLMKLLKHRF